MRIVLKIKAYPILVQALIINQIRYFLLQCAMI